MYCSMSMLTVSPPRTAYMTAVTVRTVRKACVPQSPPMFMPVQLQVSILEAGGTPSVVSAPYRRQQIINRDGKCI